MSPLVKKLPLFSVERWTIFLFFSGLILSTIHKLWAFDIWWHLKTGEWIFNHRTVPRTDLYSYTVPNHPWIDLSWGFQVLVYSAYKLLGVNGIILFKVLIVTGTFYLLFRFFYRKVPLALLLPVLSLTLFTVHERLQERPEVLSYFFLVLYLLILERNRQKTTKLVYLIPFLQIVWVNVHGLFVLGLLLIGAECLGKFFSWFSSRRPRTTHFPKKLLLIFFLSSVATLLNPYGLKGTLLPLTLFTRISGEIELFSSQIDEFIRPFASYDPSLTVFFYKLLLVLGALSFLLNHKRFPLGHGILFILFTYLSLLARRNIAPFSFVSCFLILTNLEILLQQNFKFSEYLRGPALGGLLLVFTFLLPLPFVTGIFYEHEKRNKRFGLGISEHRYVIQAADFIEKSGLAGNIFNSEILVGDYFIWRFYPKRKVFLDGRLEVYGESFFKEVFQLFRNPSLWPEWAERYQIDICILNHKNLRDDDLLLWLHQSREWVPIYFDELVILFVKNTPQNKELLETYALPFREDRVTPEDTSFPISAKRTFFVPLTDNYVVPLRKANLYTKLGLLNKAEAIYQKLLFALPRDPFLHHNFGSLLRRQGKPQEALTEYQEAIRLESKNALFRYSLGGLYLEKGQKDLALKELEKSARLDPALGETRYQLGRLYAQNGEFEKAEREYRSVKTSDAAYLLARNALGILYAQRGEFEKAEKEFRDILAHHPGAQSVLNNLKELQEMKDAGTRAPLRRK